MSVFFVPPDDNHADGFHVLTMTDDRGSMDIYTTSLRAAAIEAAFNNPTPDLLAAIDPRLEDVSQNETGRFVYRECEIDPHPRGGFDWNLPGGDCGDAPTLIAALDDIDECLLDDEPEDDDPQRHAEMQEMADDDRAHALMERRAELTA
jgi:hypothetical protein